MAGSNSTSNNSYQHNYRNVSLDERDSSSNVEDGVSKDYRQRNKRLLIAGVVVALVICVVTFMWATSPDNSSRYSNDDSTASSSSSSSCSAPVVVDDSGVALDGPGADGTCNDPEHWFDHQKVDHFNKTNTATWSQKYFLNDDYFRGPGYPIFFIMGGEGEADCLFYPFVTFTLARVFGGLTMEMEHRFYGQSQPVDEETVLNDMDAMAGLLTPDQAMADYLYFLKTIQEKYGCSTDRTSPDYCPIVTVGASYPGFLSAMMRLVHSDVVDIGYASSAPLPLYAQTVDPNAYFDKVTQSTEHTSAGCPHAIKSALLEIQDDMMALESPHDVNVYGHAAQKMGICSDQQLPSYIDSVHLLWHEVVSTVAANFADFNMANYPPAPTNEVNRACDVFKDDSKDAYEKLRGLWKVLDDSECFDFHTQIPDGPRGRVTSADWTGGGDGKTGLSWEWQTCTDLVVQAGYGPNSMFPEREWSLDALTKHCTNRFGEPGAPKPTRMVDQWHFDDLIGQGASRLLFTNGLADGWSADSILDNLSPDIVAINMPNGAHRSDLSHMGPRAADTEDIKASFPLILNAMTRWLKEIKAEAKCD